MRTIVTALIAFFFASTSLAAVNVGVFIAKERGGTGDITSNIYSAIQIKRSRPDWNVFLVEPSTEKSIEVLNGAITQTDREILLSGIPLISRTDFAKLETSVPNSINVALQFSAPSNLDLPSPQWGDLKWILTEFSIKLFSQGQDTLTSKKGEVQYLNTGPASLGVYVTRQKPQPVLSRADTQKSLDALADKTVVSAQNPATGPKKIAYSYATHFRNSKKYVDYICESARTTLATENIQLIVYDADRTKVAEYNRDLPPNVELVVLHKRPLALGISIMAHADLPMLLTGDLGPAVALDYEKPFFMETHSHKKTFKNELVAALSSRVQDPTFKTSLASVLDFENTPTEVLSYAIQNSGFWQEMGAQMAQMRTTASLADNLIDEIGKHDDLLTCMVGKH